MGFPLGAALGAVGSIAGGLLGSKGADRAADQSAAGSQAALQENGRQFDLSMLANILLNMPTINQGNTARSALSSMLGLSTPGVDYSGLSDLFGQGTGGTSGGGSGGFSIGGGKLMQAAAAGINRQLAARSSNNNNAGGRSSLGTAFGQLRDPGSSAIDPSRLMRQLAATPGFQFVKDQAMDTIMGNSRALGLGKSGATVQSVGDTIGQGIAFPMYNSYLDRLAGLAGAGSGSSAGLASNIGSLATNSGALNAGLIQNQADSRASGTLGQAGAWQGTLNNLGTIAGDYFGSGGGVRNGDVARASDGRKYWGMQF